MKSKFITHYKNAAILDVMPVIRKPTQKEVHDAGGRNAYLYKRENGKCFYCRIPLLIKMSLVSGGKEPHIFTVDHVKPLSMGGPKVSIKNLVACCNLCNRIKGNTPVEIFLQELRVIQKEANNGA